MLHSLVAEGLGSQSIHELGGGDRLRSRDRLGSVNLERGRRPEGHQQIESGRLAKNHRSRAVKCRAAGITQIGKHAIELGSERHDRVLIAEWVLWGSTGSPVCSNDRPISLAMLSTRQSAAIQFMKTTDAAINSPLSAR
jgi:hypothetical protein